MSKIGQHGIGTTDQTLAMARGVGWTKQVNGTDLLVAAKAAGHVTVYRRWEADSIQNDRIAAMDVLDFCNELEDGLKGFQPDYVEGYNETSQRKGQGLEQYADWTAAFTAEQHRRGRKVIGFSFSTGNPEIEDIQYLYNRGYCGIDALGLHCYLSTAGAFDPYHALRFSELATSVPSLPPDGIVIGETGIDAVPGGAPGWKAAGISGDQYLDRLSAYDAALAAYPYVRAALVFTSSPTPDWANYSVDSLDMSRFYIRGGSSVGTPSAPADHEAQQDQELVAAAKELSALHDRDGLIYQGLLRLGQGKVNGAGGLAAILVALNGGNPDLGVTLHPDF